MKKGFTLAEVLITLGIIGVVAAMLLPVITQKIDKLITVSKLKKSVATLHEIIRLSEKDNGELWEWDFPDKIGDDYNHNFIDSEFFKKYFEPYIKIIGNYKDANPNIRAYSIYTIDGIEKNTIYSWVVLVDGITFGLFNNPGVEEVTPGGGYYLWVYIDINGDKKPNMFGKDIFIAELVRNKRVVLWGSFTKKREELINDKYHIYSCTKGTNQQYAGGYCGALIQADGWQIKDDYPW